MGRYKMVGKVGKLTDLVGDACSELEELRDEMVSWRDNMQGTPAENTGRFTTVSETADALEGFVDEIDTSALPDDLKDADVAYSEMKVTGGRAGPSRATRCSNACQMLEAVKGKLEASEHSEEEEITTVLDAISEITENVDSLEFPGMYG